LKYILKVASDLGPIMDQYAVIVDKSTVPVGTAEKVHAHIADNAKVDFDVVSNPEFLREGVAVEDFMKPDRVVIGTKSERAKAVMNRLYAPLVRQGNPVIFMDERSAEMTKYAANAFLATKITFMNEIANLCERAGANVDDIREAPALDNIRALVDAGAKVTVYDPEAMDNVRNQIGNLVAYAHTAYAALDDADALFIVTEWPLFRTPDFDKMNLLMKGKVIFDGRNVYETEQMRDMGYTYYSVGRETILAPVEQKA